MSHRFFRVSTIAVLACLPVASALAQSKFEGVITVRLGGRTDASYSIKGDQFRMDMSAGGMSMYMLRDGAKNSMLMVMPAQQMYMEPSSMPGMAAPPAAEGRKVDFKMTGRMETIAGYECEHMLVNADEGGQYDICGAKGLGTFTAMSNPMGGRGGGGGSDSWQRGLAKDFFPLKVQKVGGEVALEVVKVEKKSLDDSMFKVPAGFQKMDMGGMRMGRPPRLE